MKKTITKPRIGIILGALATVSMGYCADATKDITPKADSAVFEGTYIPPTKDEHNNAHTQIVGANKASLPPKYLSVPDFKKCLSSNVEVENL